MSQEITDAIRSFSQKLARFQKSGKNERVISPDKDEIIQRQIREKEERFSESVISTYKIYKAPFEALGQDSVRAVSIDKDEQNLLKAYKIHKSIIDAASSNQDEQTFINKLELTSPLSQKASYTDGGQFIYLIMWLYFEQNCKEYMPFFKQTEKTYSLSFIKAENNMFDSHDKQIFDLINATFYL